MPAAPLPPMTTRQAKKLGKKQAGQYTYTASQMRRADRREELEKRKKREEEKEERKVINKRKREEQEAKERVVKRKLLQEGKIAVEDTWGKVTASQPRLNNFFKPPTVPASKRKPPTVRTTYHHADEAHIDPSAENKENEYRSQDSQEETLVNQAPPIVQPNALFEEIPEISDADLLKLLSSQPQLSQHTPSTLIEKRTPQTRSRTSRTVSTVRIMSPSILKRKRTPSPEPSDNAENEFPHNESFSELKVAEDDTAEELSDTAPGLEAFAESFSSPSKSFRSVLSEMSVANVNTRAQEKPDTTSAFPESGLATPSRPRDPFASFNSGDFEDDEQLTWDKENSDPLQTPDKPKSQDKTTHKEPEKTEAGPSSAAKRPPPPGFSAEDNFEDIYDFDFDDGQVEEDDFDDEIDDATLMTLSTQKPRVGNDKIVDHHGSPRKLTPKRDALVKPALLAYQSGKGRDMARMLPPPSRTKLSHISASKTSNEKSSAEKRLESLSFASVGDDDLLEIADQVEEELSQKSQKKYKNKGKEVAANPSTSKAGFKVPALLKKKRTLPWQMNPLPPPSTQDYLMMMADEVDGDLDV